MSLYHHFPVPPMLFIRKSTIEVVLLWVLAKCVRPMPVGTNCVPIWYLWYNLRDILEVLCRSHYHHSTISAPFSP